MKLKFFKKSLLILPALAGLMGLSSCKKLFDVQPQTVLSGTQAYRNVFDADAAVLGVYGKFMQLAKPYVLLNELRADLMSPTANADLYLQQLNKHTVTEDNPYADPTPFYEVILNCNDVLKNFNIMRDQQKLKLGEYNERYSDIAALRSFIYLQLGIHYGSVPYITDPLANIADLRNESLYPKLTFQQLVGELIKTMEAIPTTELYTSTSLITTVDQYRTEKFFINKNVILGDLYLWNGAYDQGSYRKAATAYKRVLSYYDNRGNENTQKNYYKLIGAPDPNTGNQLAVQYVRYRDADINSIYESNTEGWRSMFSRGKLSYDQQFDWEWVWVLPFSNNFAPKNPFIDLFSNRGGSYLVKPSQQAMDYWNSQVQNNSFPFDARGRFTYKTIDGQPVIMKYLYYYLDGNTFVPTINSNTRNGEWWLYRAASVWQHFGEAANRDGFPKLGYAIANLGIRSAYDRNPRTPATDFDIIQNTNSLPDPYKFDARNLESADGYPQTRAIWRDMAGLRGRANLRPIPVTNPADSLLQIEANLIQEGALELAYEGQRWSDLLRIAIRRNDPSFLTSKVAAKLRKDGFGAEADKVQAKTINDLYLPFKWK